MLCKHVYEVAWLRLIHVCGSPVIMCICVRSLFARLQLMQNQSPQQREKLVASLKDQIKKLQKDRDKIKTWWAFLVAKCDTCLNVRSLI